MKVSQIKEHLEGVADDGELLIRHDKTFEILEVKSARIEDGVLLVSVAGKE